MATTCTLVKGATTVTLPAASPGNRSVIHRPSDGMQTGAGYFGYTFGAAWWETTLEFKGVSSAQVTALDNLYDTDLGGMAQEFTYTDAAGSVHTARFLEPPEKTIQNRQSPGQFEVRMTIRTATKVV